MHRVEGDGNCLFYSLCYTITGSIREHLTLRSLIVQHLRTHIGCWRLLPNFIDQDRSIDEYIERTRIGTRQPLYSGILQLAVVYMCTQCTWKTKAGECLKMMMMLVSPPPLLSPSSPPPNPPAQFHFTAGMYSQQ